MSAGPIVLLFLAVATQAFAITLYGADLASESVVIAPNFPAWEDPTDQRRKEGGDCEGAIDGPVCLALYIGAGVKFAVLWILAALAVALNVVVFFFKALTFDIPGAPLVVRIPLAAVFIGGIGWPIAKFFFRTG